MQVKINLNNRPKAPINIDLQWSIKVTKPKDGFLAGFFRKHNRIDRDLRLSIDDIRVPKEVVCDQEKLFSILYDGHIYSQADFPVNVSLKDMTLPFQLLFHQEEVKDCLRAQDANSRKYDLYFTVNLRDNKNNVIDSKEEILELIFEPLGVRPKFAIDIDNDDIQYNSSLGKAKVATFASWIDEDYKFVPTHIAKISVKLYKNGLDISEAISFENGDTQKDVIVEAGRNRVMALPIYVDFTDISNPLNKKDDFTVEATIVTSPSYSPEIRETILQQEHFNLLKDMQGTELKTYLKMGEGKESLYEVGQSSQKMQMKFVPRSRLMGRVAITLTNLATDNSNRNAGLYIKNITLSERLSEGVRILNSDKEVLDHLLHLDGAGIDAMNSAEGLFIPNGIDSKTTLYLSFNPSEIVDVVNADSYNFKIQSVISFDYWEDKDGTGVLEENNKRTAKIPIVWDLYLEPNPEWLCVDYGSSAIVCRYDKEILDLKKRKDRIFRNAEDGKFSADSIEKGTKFLSSDIVLHDVRNTEKSTLCSQHPSDVDIPYLNLSVCLSPTSELIRNDVRKQLPCLKILMGNEYLPEKRDYLTFRYTRRDATGNLGTVEAKDTKRNKEDNSLMRIAAIFRESYSALFKYFVMPESQDKTINKLVMTYPNTYTPAHLKTLEKIARDTFPKVRKGYLRFVSESDAVAAYYLMNWDSFNPGRNMADDETVLVYDMGAGTLDLTLFKKFKNSDGKIEVQILGKIGTGKAGNYLDYLISEILTEVPGAVKGLRTVSTTSVPDVETLEERLKLKEVVKNEIKPKLSEKNSQLICGFAEFESSVILQDNRFKDFLSQITEGLLSQLFSYLGKLDLYLDTILMSGRSCRLKPLQDALRNATEELGFSNTRILKFKDGGDKEKTVVVEGAMAKAGIFSSPESPVLIKSRRLYASYGLMYKTFGSWHYVELLNSSDMPLADDSKPMNEFEGPNVIVQGTAAAETLKLVQTYMSPEDTERAYNDKNFEFITEMEEYNMEDFGHADTLNAKLLLDYKNNVSLYVNGLLSVGSAPKGVDLTSEITKRSIWPVTI